MRPPRCDVCGVAGERAMFTLVTFVPTESDREWRERNDRGEVVGHPPDTGWFCGDHSAAAQALADSEHLRGAVETLVAQRGGQESAAGTDNAHGSLTVEGIDNAIRPHLAQLARELGIADAVVETATDRTWHPMDGASPPDCPYADRTTVAATGADGHVTLTRDTSWWNSSTVSRDSVTVVSKLAQETVFSVTAHAPADGSSGIEYLRTTGELPPLVSAAISS